MMYAGTRWPQVGSCRGNTTVVAFLGYCRDIICCSLTYISCRSFSKLAFIVRQRCKELYYWQLSSRTSNVIVVFCGRDRKQSGTSNAGGHWWIIGATALRTHLYPPSIDCCGCKAGELHRTLLFSMNLYNNSYNYLKCSLVANAAYKKHSIIWWENQSSFVNKFWSCTYCTSIRFKKQLWCPLT